MGKGKRVALGELTPGAIARRTWGGVNQPAAHLSRDDIQRSRPRLSPDKVGRHFTVKVVGGEEWAPRDVRFMLWYYCRTVLTFDSIATAYNSTYLEADNRLNAEEAEVVVETIKQAWPQIKQDLEPGHFALPDDWGWHPCDHLMNCNPRQTRERPTVMRGLKTRVAGVKLIKEILTTMWPGSWEELLQCPRSHQNFQDDELEHHSQQLHVKPHADHQDFPAPQMSEENKRVDRMLDEISLDDDTDESILIHGYDVENQPFHRVVRAAGGPKALFVSIETFLKVTILISLLAHWCNPIHPEKTDCDLIRISALDLESVVLMLCGGYSLVGTILNFLKIEVLVFHGADEPPPLTAAQKLRAITIGFIAAMVLASWQGWLFRVHNHTLKVWFNSTVIDIWLRRIGWFDPSNILPSKDQQTTMTMTSPNPNQGLRLQ